jgi:hypothetical protein
MSIRAYFIGVQEGFMHLPSIELWNLLDDIPGHPAGSTVSRRTIEAVGVLTPVANS